MTAVLHRIDDPRDNLQKARRRELVEFAHANGLTEVNEQMDADVIRDLLRSKGMSRISIPKRPLGGSGQVKTFPLQRQAAPAAQAPVQLDPAAFAQFQQFLEWQKKQAATPTAEKTFAEMGINELRAACRARGIHIGRKDKMEDLRAKLG